ncbi:hypothetical protein [Tolypothrix sp. VBCCA 56010]|uniref:hypothetical protein n=1 Tax=Tolypothrix sp. VBCCA 56010 TaxID=3137731 RepID=UPI003D7D206D
MGQWAWKESYLFTDEQTISSLIPNAHCPLPIAHCPMPNSQCPMPNAPLFFSALLLRLLDFFIIFPGKDHYGFIR